MKRILTLSIIVCAALNGFAQTDTTGKPGNEPDTIKVGGMIIIRKSGGGHEIVRERKDNDIALASSQYQSQQTVECEAPTGGSMDLGFSNFNDKTNYSSAPRKSLWSERKSMNHSKLENWKSRNVNIWFFMQSLNVIEHVVNLKYGFGT